METVEVEVVVKIPKFVYDMTKAQKKVIDADAEIVGKAIANGTVLPKRHDALIERAQVTNYDNLYDVPAVIEADKEE